MQLTVSWLLHTTNHIRSDQWKKLKQQFKIKSVLEPDHCKISVNVLFWNVQGVESKIDAIEQLNESNDVNVVCIAEHWLNLDSIELLKINNFRLVNYFCRTNISKSECAIFSKI